MNEHMLKNIEFQKSLINQSSNYTNCAQTTTALYFQDNQSYIWKRIKHGFSKRVTHQCETKKIVKKEQVEDFIYAYIKKLIGWIQKGEIGMQQKDLKQQITGLKNELKRINKLSVENEGRVERRNAKIAKLQKNIQSFLQRLNQGQIIQMHNNSVNKFKTKTKQLQIKYVQCKQILQQVLSNFIFNFSNNRNNFHNLFQNIIEPKVQQLIQVKKQNEKYIQLIKNIYLKYNLKQIQLKNVIKQQQKNNQHIKNKYQVTIRILVNKLLNNHQKYQKLRIQNSKLKEIHKQQSQNLVELLKIALNENKKLKSQINNKNEYYQQLEKNIIRMEQNFYLINEQYKNKEQQIQTQKKYYINQINILRYKNIQLIKQLQTNNKQKNVLIALNQQKLQQDKLKIKQLDNLMFSKQKQMQKITQKLIIYERNKKQIQFAIVNQQDEINKLQQQLSQTIANLQKEQQQNNQLNKTIIQLQQTILQKQYEQNKLNMKILQYENKLIALQDKISELTIRIENETQKQQKQCKISTIMTIDDTETSAQTFLSKQFTSPFHQKDVAIHSYTDHIQICNKNKLDFAILYQLCLTNQMDKKQQFTQTEHISHIKQYNTISTQSQRLQNQKQIQTYLYQLQEKEIQTQENEQSQSSIQQIDDYVQQIDRGTQYSLDDISKIRLSTIHHIIQIKVQNITIEKCQYQKQKLLSQEINEISKICVEGSTQTYQNNEHFYLQQYWLNLLMNIVSQKQLYRLQSSVLSAEVSQMKKKILILQHSNISLQNCIKQLKLFNNNIEQELTQWKKRFIIDTQNLNQKLKIVKSENQLFMKQKKDFIQCIQKLNKQNEEIKNYNSELLQTIEYANSLFCGSASKIMKNTKKEKDISALMKASPKKIISQYIFKQQQNQLTPLNDIQSVSENTNNNQKLLQQIKQQATFTSEKHNFDEAINYYIQDDNISQQICEQFSKDNNKQIQQNYKKHLDTNSSAVKRLLADFVNIQNKQNNKLAAFETLVEMLQPNSEESEKFENFIKSRKLKNGLLQENSSNNQLLLTEKADLKQKLFRFLTQN